MYAGANRANRDWGRIVVWGGIAGLIGGIAMAMLMMIVTAVMGMGFLKPLYLIAATFHRSWAADMGFHLGPMLVGAMTHMFNAILFGIIFALLLAWIVRRGAGIGGALVAGMIWGIILLVFNQFVTLQIFDPPLAHAVTMTSTIFIWWLISHLMYGAITGAIVGAMAEPSLRSHATPEAQPREGLPA